MCLRFKEKTKTKQAKQTNESEFTTTLRFPTALVTWSQQGSHQPISAILGRKPHPPPSLVPSGYRAQWRALKCICRVMTPRLNYHLVSAVLSLSKRGPGNAGHSGLLQASQGLRTGGVCRQFPLLKSRMVSVPGPPQLASFSSGFSWR